MDKHLPLRHDDEAAEAVAADFGGMVRARPAGGVLHPRTELDIAELVRFCHASAVPVTVRGQGHSTWGQSVAVSNGVVVRMRSLAESGGRPRIEVVGGDGGASAYADVGAEQLWSEVTKEALGRGLAARGWLDYLDLTVGGTLSAGGIGGYSFRHGPLVRNVLELDVITGKGEMLTCSGDMNPDLFYGVLGGLGQFGVITRARIPLDPSPSMVRWMALVYTDFTIFSNSQEYLISQPEEDTIPNGVSYLEGFFFVDGDHVENFISPFLSPSDRDLVGALADEVGGVYIIEAALQYRGSSVSADEIEGMEAVLGGVGGGVRLRFDRDLPYAAFVDRVRREEEKLRRCNLWELRHPWVNFLVPKSRMATFDEKVFRGCFREEKPLGVLLVYPLNGHKWDVRWSLMFPEEERIFYKVGLLIAAAAAVEDTERIVRLVEEIKRFCDDEGLGAKEYIPHYGTTEEWKKYYGSKWERMVELKRKYDPKAILAPGQKMFTTPCHGNFT